jgi:hypothetical protein
VTDNSLQHCVPGRWRCPKCNFVMQRVSLNFGDGTLTADSGPGEVCPNDGATMWRVSYREAYEEMCSVAQSERFASLAIIERLVETEGASVTILCENPEGSGPDNHAVLVSDDWTDWHEKRFEGRTRYEALCKAEDARIAHRLRRATL